ncbi:hypothetical protein B2M26_12990 [Ferroacidibacillus organovorans]|uniref:Uncharacterized protein n=1 Tax=Ferroacidibacillus organovorans TaxID=1765683 RepID=A0A1V4EQR7_9BACL|nr:hypothetical protein B2M26_12990 [Ferroacidibacillus organovorans]
MQVYIVHPRVTLDEDKYAIDFYEACVNEVNRYLAVTSIANASAMETVRTTNEDVLIFFNRSDQNYPEHFIDFIQNVSLTGCNLFPVAVTESHRLPPKVAGSRQSYDIQEQLQQRKLTVSQAETIGIVFARSIISHLQPTIMSYAVAV